MSVKTDARTSRQIDRLLNQMAELADLLEDEADGDPELMVTMRDLLDVFAHDDDVPVYRRNQARDLLRNVDKELVK